jgi:sentrin-specific protease 8
MKAQNNQNSVILRYHYCRLRQADVNLLHGSHWLNNAIIGFYFEYLKHKYEASATKLKFTYPQTTELLNLFSAKDNYIILNSMDVNDKDFIFFPMNDCSSRDLARGSHWSLIVFSKIEKTCFYFDSSRGLIEE